MASRPGSEPLERTARGVGGAPRRRSRSRRRVSRRLALSAVSVLDHPTGGPLCEGCWSALPRHPEPAVCGAGTPLAGATGVCGRCRRGLSPFERGFSLGPYDGGLRVLIHELKFRGRQRVAERLAETIVSDAASGGTL